MPRPRPHSTLPAALTTALLLAALLGPPARAGAPTAKAPRERGLQAVVALGMDGCTGRQCWNTLPLVYTRVHLLYRALPYLSAGLHLAFNFLAPDFPAGSGRVEFWDLLVGPEVRGVLPVKQVDLWVGAAFGYYRTERFVDDEGHNIESFTNSVGIGWGLGMDYYLITGRYGRLAVGGDLWFYKPFPIKLCTEVGGNGIDCHDTGLADQFGVVYAAGATLTWFHSL